jgi:hypothetical protein
MASFASHSAICDPCSSFNLSAVEVFSLVIWGNLIRSYMFDTILPWGKVARSREIGWVGMLPLVPVLSHVSHSILLGEWRGHEADSWLGHEENNLAGAGEFSMRKWAHPTWHELGVWVGPRIVYQGFTQPPDQWVQGTIWATGWMTEGPCS